MTRTLAVPTTLLALALLSSSLTRFGVLGLGSKETLQGTPVEGQFRELPAGVRLYRRLG